jgi:hypothetical protein
MPGVEAATGRMKARAAILRPRFLDKVRMRGAQSGMLATGHAQEFVSGENEKK